MKHFTFMDVIMLGVALTIIVGAISLAVAYRLQS